MVSSENTYTSNIQTEQAIFRNAYAYTYMHTRTINEKEVMNLKEQGGVYRSLEGGMTRRRT